MALRMLAVIGCHRPATENCICSEACEKTWAGMRKPYAMLKRCNVGGVAAVGVTCHMQLGTSWNYIGTDSRYIVVGDAQVAI